jgi:glycosyltransferase involved in cell wall biosynthesis
MQILLVHQNFPGQFRYLAPAWIARGHHVVAMGCTPPSAFQSPQWHGLRYASYDRHHTDLADRAQAVEHLCQAGIKARQITPDLVIAHSAWGESLPLRRLFPSIPLVIYPELWGSQLALGDGFDHDRPPFTSEELEDIEAQNHLTATALADADAVVVPTEFQRASFPAEFQSNLQVIHEGINTDQLKPDHRQTLLLPSGLMLGHGDPVVSFASRSLEPLRGLHRLFQAIPAVLAEDPGVQVVVVGGSQEGYGPISSQPGGHLGQALAQLPNSVDLSRVHVVGQLPYEQLIRLFQITRAHIYLSYPYTLSWSVLEAMACGAPIIGNLGGPIEEVVRPRSNGLLVPFNEPATLAEAIIELLQRPFWGLQMGLAGRQTVVENYSISQSLVSYDKLFQTVGLAVHGANPTTRGPAGRTAAE